MEKSEISVKNKIYITDVARLTPYDQARQDLDYKSDRSELILENVLKVSET
jgi:hypothetical protein